MSSVNSTSVSAVSRMRGFWLASTALVGIRILPQPAPSVLHLPSSASLLQARLARLLALAIETPASLLARLNPLRSARMRKVRPAARVGRRKWREAALAAATSVLLTTASTAHAEIWNGGNGVYNFDGNWDPAGAPVRANQSATFAGTGSATVNVSAPIAPGAWTFNNNAQSYTITGAQVTFGATGITNNAAAGTTVSIANVIAGSGGVTQAGGGILTLSGANTYTGGTTISAGTLNVAGSHAGFVSVANGATLRVAATGEISQAGSPVVGGSEGTAFTIVNLGKITNTGSSNVNTSATVTLITGAGSMLTSDLHEAFSAAGANSSIVNAAGATIRGGADTNYGRVNLGNSATVANYGTIAGSATLAGLGGTSAVLVTGSNSTVDLHEGSRTGTVRLGADSTLSLYTGSGTAAAAVTTTDPVTGEAIILRTAGTEGARAAAIVGDIALGAGSTLALRGTGDGTATNGVTGLFGGSLSGATALTKSDSGTFVLSGANSYTGATTISGGTLVAANAAALGGTAGGTTVANGARLSIDRVAIGAEAVTLNGGTALTATGTASLAGPVTLAATSTIEAGTNAALTLSGVVSGAGLTKGEAGALVLTGANTYTGTTTLAGGTLTVGSAGALGGGGPIQFNIGSSGGALQYSAANQTDYSARFSTGNDQAFRIDTNGQAVTYATGLASQGGSLTKLGANTLTLTGDSSYTGATTISGGILQIGDGGKTGSIAGASAVGIAAGAGLVLDKADGYTIVNGISGAGAVTVQGAAAANNLVTFSGALTQTGGFTVADASSVMIAQGGSYNAPSRINLNGGAFTNLGTVTVTENTGASPLYDAVRANVGGTITNGSPTVTGATIRSAATGILTAGTTTSTVENYGLVTGVKFDGIGQNEQAGALIVNNRNGAANGTGGVVYGQGTTTGGYGVFNLAGSALTVTNESASRIVGRTYGVYGTGAATSVTNAGTIASGSYDTITGAITVGGTAGVQLSAGGTVTNSGTVQGGVHGIDSSVSRLALTNLGTGAISGGSSDGVVVRGGASTVLNAGSITSNTTSGIALGSNAGATLTVTNAVGGTITGGSNATFGYGVGANTQAATINNYGSIGSGARGLVGFANGTLNANLYAGSATGSILGSGGNDTVSLYTGVFNQAVVTTPYTDAVTGVPSTVTLQNSGAVAAATVGTIALEGGTNTLNLRGTGTYDGVTGPNETGARGVLNMSNVSGVSTLDKADSGTFVLTGGYVGPNGAPLALTTKVEAGRLIEQVTGGVTSHVFGTGTVDIASGAVVELSGSFLQGVNTFTGAGRIEKTGAGEVRFGSGNGQTIIEQSKGGVIDVEAGLLRGSSSGNGIWTNNRGSLTIASGATFDGVEGTIVVDELTGAGTLQGGFGGSAKTTTIGVANGSATFDGTIRNAPIESRTSDDSRVGILALTKAGTGTQTLSGTSTYSGDTTITGGTLKAGAATGFSANSAFTVNALTTLDLGGFSNTIGALSGAGTVTNSGTGVATLSTGGLNQSPTFSGVISNGTNAAAATGLTKSGTGTLTLTGANTYTGATAVSGGTLQINDGGRIGQSGATFSNVATTGGTLAINRSDAYTYGGLVTGSGTFSQTGTGTTTLTGVNGTGNQFTGTANVTGGTLAVNGTFGDTVGRAATVNVASGGTLHGTGRIAGSVNVNGGIVSAGNSPGTLTVSGDYTLNSGSTSLFEMGAAGQVGGTNNDLINVGGSLTLGGALRLVDTASPANPLVSGYYRLFNYNENTPGAGAVATGNFDTVSVATGSTADVYKSAQNQVNVLVRNGTQSMQFWDGADMTGGTAGPGGGDGTWSSTNTNWTTSPDGQINDRWRSGVGIFGGTAGTVTVAADDVQSIQALQFATSGYTLTGGTLNLRGDVTDATRSFITVDGGTATIASDLVSSGTVGLTKRGAGTLILSGDNGYSGGTTFAAGILNVGSANAIGTAGTLSFTGGTLQYSAVNATDYSGRFSTADSQAYSVDTNRRNVTYATGLTSAGGSLTKIGAGMLTLTGAGTYAGTTTISGGTLQIGNGGTTGAIGGGTVTVAGGTTLALNRSGTLAFSNAVSGAGALTVRGAISANDSITLSGALRQTGGFTVADPSNVTLSGSYEAGRAITLSGGGTFTNRGTVTVSGDAIFTSETADTTVVNADGARIEGGNSGVIQLSSTGTGALAVTNSGVIRGNGYDGVTQHGSGALTVNNTGTGIIYGQNGTPSSNGYGVGSDGTGVLTLTNQAGGKIVGQYGVVGSNVGDQITNAGTIASGTLNQDGSVAPGGRVGVDLREGGTVTNQAGGLIQGGGNALRSVGALVLRNAGTIASPSSDGILTSSTFDIRNAGTISSSVNSGIAAVSGRGTIVNARGGAFTGGASTQFGYGVQFAGGTGTVDNYGTLNSTRAASNGGSGGIYAYDPEGRGVASVTANLYAGSTTGEIRLGGGDNTVALYTGTGTSNAGVVVDGTRLQNAGTLAAAAFGTIDFGGQTNTPVPIKNLNTLALRGPVGSTKTLVLRGDGDGTEVNGAAGTLALGSVSGAGIFNKRDSGTWTLTGQTVAPVAGMTANINGGILAVNGTFGDAANSAAVNVNDGGTLHGSGIIAGSVVVASGGTVSAGNSPGTLTVNRDYTLNAGATSLFELGASGVVGGDSNDLIKVGRNLQLGGTLSLVSAANATSAPVSGVYRIYNYGGELSGEFGAVTTPTAGSKGLVYTNIPNQVNVLLTNGNQSVQYFDGSDTTGASVGGQGGTGPWNATTTNWTMLPGGQVNDVWRSGVGIFGGSSAGAVTVAGARDLQGLQFVTDGYELGGTGTLNLMGDVLTPTQSFVSVDRNVGVTIANALTSTEGTIGLRKLGDGTLTLTGASTFTGATTVEAGTLAIAAGGSIVSAVTNRAVFTNAGTATGGLTNSGSFTNTGTLSGGLTNTGTVTVSSGRIDGAIANTAGTVTISGTVASDGSFANANGATLAVAGTGAYGLGGLLTNAGSLTVASGGSLTAPAGIVNSGSIRVAQGGTITDALANTGSVINDGAYNADVSNSASGSLANSATGVWTGNLTANTGTVGNAGQWRGDGRNDAGGSVTNTGNWTTTTGPFANAGTLTTSGVLNGGLANTGGVQASGRIVGAVSNGAGASFALTGPLSGVTTFANDGTLDLGGTAFTVGSLSGSNTAATLRNGALTTGGDNSSTAYAGTIADGAAATSLTKNGTGSLTLTGANTYTGGTVVNAGTLVAAAANLGSGPVTNNSDLIVDQAGDATLGSAINGTGRFVKRGAGALTYTGTGTLSGATTVETGRLSVNGGLASSFVTVANAATLGGAGTVGGVVATAGSAVAPGAAPGAVGTLRVAGNVLFASRSLYQVDATASGQADRIAATGTATLQGGTVQVTAQAGAFTPTTSYTILSAAGGLTGRFAGVTSNFAYLTPFLTYDANDAYLRLARNDLQFATTAQTRNQGNVAGAAQATGVGARLYDAIAVLSAPQSRVAFDALSGEIHQSAVTAQFENAFLVREAVLDRLRWGDAGGFGGALGQGIGQRFAPGTTLPGAYTADLPGRAPTLAAIPTRLVDPNPVAVWGQGFGSFGATATDGNAARLARQTSGFVLGADARVENDWRLGAAGGYSFTNLDITGRLSSGTVESGYGAVYAGGPLGDRSPLQLRLGATYGGNSLTTRRAVTFAGFSDNAGARYGGTTAQGFAEVGYRVGTGASYLEPFIGAAAIRLGRDGFSETGGAAAVTAQGRDYDLATSTIGLRAEGRLSEVFASDLPIMVRALVGYRRAYGDVVPSALLAFAGGQQFVSAGIPIDRDALVAQAGVDWQMAPSTTLGVNYTGQVGQRAQDHGVKGNFTYRF